jgi:hypothetical protein
MSQLEHKTDETAVIAVIAARKQKDRGLCPNIPSKSMHPVT